MDLIVDSGDPAPALTVVSTVILTVIGGLLVGLDMNAAAVQTAYRVVVAGLLGAALAAPMALVSSWRRGYLPGFVVLLALAVVTQIVTTIGAGAWFPYAAPALWMGMGGASAASQVSVIRLLLPPLVAAIGVVATLSWWRAPRGRMSANARPTRESPIRRGSADEHPSLYVD